MKKKVIEELEIVRAIAFIFILIQHTIGGYSISPDAPLNNAVILRFIYSISRAGVPIFIFISGLSLCYTYSEGINISRFYKKRLMTIMLPYIFCTLIYIYVFGKKVDNILISLITGNTIYHLWYIGTCIQLYLLFPIILYLLNKLGERSTKFNISFIAIFILINIVLITNKAFIDNWGSQLIFNKPNFHLKEFISISPLFYSLYFLLGYYFSRYLKAFKKYISAFKIYIVLIFIIFLIINYITIMQDKLNINLNAYIINVSRICFNLASVLFLFLLSLYLVKNKKKLTSILKIISHYSFGAYLLHVAVIEVLAGVLYTFYKLKNDYIFPSVTLFILALIFCPIFCHFLSKLPFSKYVFGVSTYRVIQDKFVKSK
ncbi:MAG TPA: acyltransferase [Clostridiaceae bacterium]